MFDERTMDNLVNELDDTWPNLVVRLDTESEEVVRSELDILKSEGKAHQTKDTVKSLIAHGYVDGSLLHLTLRPGYHPFLQVEGRNGPLLSVLTHLVSGPVHSSIDQYILQIRGSGMKLAPGQIQTAGAGFVEFGEQPYETALRELEEEALRRYEIESYLCQFLEPGDDGNIGLTRYPKRILDFLSFTLEIGDGYPNPLVNYAAFIPEAMLTRIPQASSVEDLRRYTGPESEANCVRVSLDILPDLLDEISTQIGFYGPCKKSIYNLLRSLKTDE